jgi:hypothetical protein
MKFGQRLQEINWIIVYSLFGGIREAVLIMVIEEKSRPRNLDYWA